MTERAAIVFGGGGFVGTNLCRNLVFAGAKVRAFGRRRLFPDALADVDWVQGDLEDATAVRRALEPGAIVFHLIYGAPSHALSPAQYDTSATRRLLDACLAVGVARVVFVSSGGTVYGNATQIPTTENAPTTPITPYAINNVAIEQSFALYQRSSGLDYRVLRVTNAYGPFQTANKGQGVIATLIKHALRGERIEIWGNGSVVRDFIYISDVVDALYLAAEDRSDDRVLNIGSGHGSTLLDIIALIEKILDIPLKLSWKPERPSDILTSVVAIDRARAALGWKPKVDLVEGLKRTIAWWRQAKL
jgi:UDP-glucose 4-epimerase